MAASKVYSRVNWASYPSMSTPLTAVNLNKMDKGCDDLDDRVVGLLNRMDTAETNISSQGSSITSLTTSLTTLVNKLLVFTEPVECEIGDETCTIEDEAILTTSIIDVYSENDSETPIQYESCVTTTGQAVLSFDALEEATSFILHVINL